MRNGATWQAAEFHRLYEDAARARRRAARDDASRYREHMHSNVPVHDWPRARRVSRCSTSCAPASGAGPPATPTPTSTRSPAARPTGRPTSAASRARRRARSSSSTRSSRPGASRRSGAAMDGLVARARPARRVLTTIQFHRRSRDAFVARYDATHVAREGGAARTACGPVPDAPRRARSMVWLEEHGALVPGDRLIGDDAGGVRLCPPSWLRYLPSGITVAELRAALAPAARPPGRDGARLARRRRCCATAPGRSSARSTAAA